MVMVVVVVLLGRFTLRPQQTGHFRSHVIDILRETTGQRKSETLPRSHCVQEHNLRQTNKRSSDQPNFYVYAGRFNDCTGTTGKSLPVLQIILHKL